MFEGFTVWRKVLHIRGLGLSMFVICVLVVRTVRAVSEYKVCT